MLENSPLGRTTNYPDRYDASLLFGIPRAAQRAAIGIRGELPFDGVDLWTAYELSWLDERGKPQVAICKIQVPARSNATVESKSLKLYLGSFSQETSASVEAVAGRIERDLGAICDSRVRVRLKAPTGARDMHGIADLPGESIDAADIAVNTYRPASELLKSAGAMVDESLRSALFRSNCPVTGQPDYADVLVRYSGPRIDRESLLRYLVSYREHAAFHETCVERIFVDLSQRCLPVRLTVYARFLRRGGIDINPFRSNFETPPDQAPRTPRQ